MDEELKAYVNAYMDGLEVEYRFNMQWYSVDALSDFDKICNEYRIKPKAEDKWQRVELLENHVANLDDTVTRLALEMAELKKMG